MSDAARAAAAVPASIDPGAPVSAPPVPAEAGGVRIRRAWPRADGTQTVEGYDDAGRLRAGTWHGAANRLDLLGYGHDPKLAGLSGALASGAELIVHRAGRRAVVRAGDRYIKVLRRGRAAGVAEASSRLGELVRDAGGVSAAVLETGEDRVVFGAVPGVPLRGLQDLQGADGLARWRTAWEEFADVWSRLVTRNLPAGSGAGEERAADEGAVAGGTWARHDARAEADVVREWVGHLRRHDPLELRGEEIDRLEERCLRATSDLLAGTGAGDRLAVAHRDLHDEQLLFDPATGRIGLLDFDTAALAEPALDLGNLLAHLSLRRDQRLITGPARDSARQVLVAAARRCRVPQQRLAAYEAASRLRLIGVYAFRPPWRDLARDWLRAD